MASSYILEGMRVIRRWALDKPDPEVGLCIGEKRMGDERGRVISWPDGRETVQSVSELVPLDEEGKPVPIGQWRSQAPCEGGQGQEVEAEDLHGRPTGRRSRRLSPEPPCSSGHCFPRRHVRQSLLGVHQR